MKRFFRTPKGLLTIILVVLVVMALVRPTAHVAIPGLLSAILLSALVDVPILRSRKGTWEFPSGAILTAMLVAMVLSPHEPWYVTVITSLLAVFSKYVARTRSANIFNPAALGLVATFYWFHTGQSWWGALAEVSPWFGISAVILTGVFITDRVNKMPLVLAFLGVYFLLFTATSFVVDPARVAEIFVPPDVNAALFFAFFILTDPPTSPVKYREQVICGVLVAVVSYGVYELVGAAYYLLAGVLVGNLYEAWRRASAFAQRVAASTALAE